MATPMISGSVAVLRQAYPNETANQILSRLQQSGVNVTDPRNGVTRRLPSISQALAVDLPNVTELVKTASNASVYLVTGGSKYGISNMDLYNAFSVLGPIRVVTQDYLDSFSQGGALSNVVGSTTDSNVYLIIAGIRLRFPSCDLVEAFGYSCDGLVKLPPAQLARFYNGPGVTGFLKSVNSATVYFALGGQKRPIASWGDLVGLGVPFIINVYTDDFVNSIPTGNVLFGGGGLIKTANSATVYAVNDWESSPSVFPVSSFNHTIDLGLGTSVRVVSNSQLSQYAVGSNLKSNVKCGSNTYIGTGGILYKISPSLYSHFNYSGSSFLSGGSICNRFTFSQTQMSRFILNNGTIYLVENGKKRGFTSYTAYLNNGGSPSNTIPVSDSFANSLPNGGAISS